MLTGPWADVRVALRAADGAAAATEVVLFLTLVPDIVVADVLLRAPERLPHDRLQRAARVEVGDRFRDDTAALAVARLERALAELGFPRARVRADVLASGDDARQLVFDIDPGPPVALARLSITGDPRLSAHEVAALTGVEQGAPFDRLGVEQGLEKVRALLWRRRHLNAVARIDEVTAVDGGSAVTLFIDAGPRYRVRFVGNYVLPDATLRTVVHEGKMESADATDQARARAALESAYRQAGYARVRVRVDDVPARPPHDDDAERELRFHIDEGPRAAVTDVLVVGAAARAADELVAEIKRTVDSEAPQTGLLQQLDSGDVDDLLGRPSGRPPDARPFEVSDEGIELLPRPLIGRKPVYIEALYVEAGRRVQDVYRSDGFLDARVDGPFTDFSDDGTEIRVRYTVREG
jgi:outer membrane protein assembly factor BamA